MSVEQGIIQLYTGNGKGKTTAALGAALRAVGHGMRVVVIQFMKGRPYGELLSADGIDGLTVEQYGRDGFVDPDNLDPIDRELAEKGWERAKELAHDEIVDMLVLDELNIAVSFGLIAIGEVLEFMKNKPRRLDLILTGRNAPEEMIELADTVTEMREVKHHYQAGIKSREGIEY